MSEDNIRGRAPSTSTPGKEGIEWAGPDYVRFSTGSLASASQWGLASTLIGCALLVTSSITTCFQCSAV